MPIYYITSSTFGSPWEAKMVLRRSKGYDPTVAAQPANAPLTYERYGLKWIWSSARKKKTRHALDKNSRGDSQKIYREALRNSVLEEIAVKH